jgi:DNA repair protein RecN (Recombination protein N)
MLRGLTIQNYAIIESIGMPFDAHFNVITGETGAGKSILLGALSLILGKRADTSVLRNQKEKCFVEATFYIKGYGLEPVFEANDLEFEDETIIRREISPAGKSRAFINDMPVTLDILQQVTERLVDVHAQGETRELLDEYFFCGILDELSGQRKEAGQYAFDYKNFKEKQKQLQALEERQQQLQREYDFNAFLLNELNEAGLDAEEAEKIESELSLMQHAESIQRNLSEAYQLLDGHELSAMPQLLQANKLIGQLASYSDVFSGMHHTLGNLIEELKSVSRQITQNADATEYSESRVQELSEKQSMINRLLQKHQAKGVPELLGIQQELQERISQYSGNQETISQLRAEIRTIQEKLSKQASALSSGRKKQVRKFEEKVSALLKELGMPYGIVELKMMSGDLNPHGIDKIYMHFTPNKGIAAKPLNEVGSGGEKSRLMLAIKSFVAETVHLPTLVFDEIDTGISGEVALKVGSILQHIGKKHQLISITHLPQVAAKANKHFFVYKNHEKAQTYTEIKVLNDQERVQEIAVMLSGENPPKAALENAKVLLN